MRQNTLLTVNIFCKERFILKKKCIFCKNKDVFGKKNMIYVFLQATLKSLIKFLTDQEKEAGFGHTGHFKHLMINKKVKSAQ